ncbi:MAG: immunity 42 family protein [Xanthobacteraceae bacterium]|nr:immunity 42 family protein [Xanthobacteraceae bacterium]
MGTLIGQRERVAVEFELQEVEPEYKHWLYGTMSLWAGGHRISRHGRHDEVCTLTVALTSFPGILRDAVDRIDARLMAMPAAEAFEVMHEAIYGDEPGSTYQQTVELNRHFGGFEVFPNGFEVFDGHHGFLIEDRLVGRLIWCSTKDKVVHEARIGAGEFDRVIDGFLTVLEKASGQTRTKIDT